MFHVTTVIKDRMQLDIQGSVPGQMIHHLAQARDMQGARLHAFCVLPDHMHVLFRPGCDGLSVFMHAFKKNSSRAIPCLSWQKGYHDERIQNAKQRSAVIAYIEGNAMKHGLVGDGFDWPWSSLRYPELIDPLGLWE